ncbi:bacteriophage tail protein [Shigella sonnei]|nr:bacteriophage tail protein [Shigella sonnei]
MNMMISYQELVRTFPNNVHVMRFVSGSIQSNKTINITGRVNPSDYGNFDSRYVRDVRLGTRVV